MPQPHRIALLGFSAAERKLLSDAFEALPARTPAYSIGPTMLPMLDDADFIIADADHAASVQLVVVTERVGDTVFIGARPPPFGAAAWMPRPIDAPHVMRELNALLAPGLAPVLDVGATELAPQIGSTVDLELDLVIDPGEASMPPYPILPELSQPDQAVPVSLRPWSPPSGGQVLTALVVDDSETARQFLRTRLEAWNLQVKTAASSGQALSLLMREHFDYLFIDVELGAGSQLDGLGLCQLVRRKQLSLGGTPELVVIVSAHHGQLDRARGTLAGCDAYLGKPLDETDLSALLRRQGLKPLPRTEGQARG
jgi:CheY-like chemotaxis protein